MSAQVLDLVARERQFTVQAYGSREVDPIVVTDARGCEVFAADGSRYLDLTAQTASCAVGYRHPLMLERLHAQLERSVVSPAHIHPLRVELAERLIESSRHAFARCWFGVTGSDAIEAALKMARLRSGRWKVISHLNGYHGSTLGALSAHGIGAMRRPFEPLLPGFLHVHPPDDSHGHFPPGGDTTAAALAQLQHVVAAEGPGTIAAITVEPIFAGGGVFVPPDDYLRGLREICDQHGILLVFDEVVTGMGRTGYLFAYEHSGVIPDLLVLGKGLTSGYQALSAVLAREPADPYAGGDTQPLQLHTMAANPMGCAAALATLAILAEERLVENAAERGAQLLTQLRDKLAGTARVREVRGRGLLIGIELQCEPDEAKVVERDAVRACRDHGVLVYGSSGPHAVLVLHPPLVISEQQVATGAAAIQRALATVS